MTHVQVDSAYSGKLAVKGVGSFADNLARFALRPLRFAHVPAICLDKPACSKSARLQRRCVSSFGSSATTRPSIGQAAAIEA
jgi:hypothetical protein